MGLGWLVLEWKSDDDDDDDNKKRESKMKSVYEQNSHIWSYAQNDDDNEDDDDDDYMYECMYWLSIGQYIFFQFSSHISHNIYGWMELLLL